MGDPCTCSWGAPHGEPCYDKRPAQGSDGVDRPWSPRERYMLFVDGFRAGASTRALDPRKQGLAAYDRGVSQGREARNVAVAAFAQEIGYEPTVLRAAPKACTTCDKPLTVIECFQGVTPGRYCSPKCIDAMTTRLASERHGLAKEET